MFNLGKNFIEECNKILADINIQAWYRDHAETQTPALNQPENRLPSLNTVPPILLFGSLSQHKAYLSYIMKHHSTGGYRFNWLQFMASSFLCVFSYYSSVITTAYIYINLALYHIFTRSEVKFSSVHLYQSCPKQNWRFVVQTQGD